MKSFMQSMKLSVQLINKWQNKEFSFPPLTVEIITRHGLKLKNQLENLIVFLTKLKNSKPVNLVIQITMSAVKREWLTKRSKGRFRTSLISLEVLLKKSKLTEIILKPTLKMILKTIGLRVNQINTKWRLKGN